jgi:predicted SprT family Zn-dependent metalloprotease
MNLINPNFKVIKYGKKRIKVIYSDLLKTDSCYGLYDTNKQTVNFDQNMKGELFLNTLLHEIFHIIIFNDGIKVKDRGEEPIVMALGDGLTKILKQNKKVRDYIYDCFDNKKML